ncbi:hypothetical protein CWI25_16720 [Pseudomonas aeruginosa]|uniref:hypothetical protein n=1 Tax=Pseudomonas aeruginosa TaxID=287 RepID=UPI000C2BF20A|nr:hypothetical protein [Pseudomonas aeruginosa]AUA71572.1 hypothetical protein CWI25_16720 [Pseudomonas aeruginosa]AUA96130.1 hypothetical protein CWI24_16880 [Pseudomonas aeruginosa]HBO9091763.1 hypothetical protein [Pseudomonas aeruginosa]HCF0562208.1 hypothetical protein [Pseudomonas aeruginosa]
MNRRPRAVLDIECYRNYFLIMLRCIETRRTKAFELYDDVVCLDRKAIISLLRKYTVVTFNGRSYDMPMLFLALRGATTEELKDASDAIIQGNLKPWEFEERYGVKIPTFVDHIDLIEVAPGVASLKIYGGRLHSRRMQDLPIEPDALITAGQRKTLVNYCGNDLDTTIDLHQSLIKQLDLRESMSDEYGIDLRSKSDAQIAEAVIRNSIQRLTGEKVYAPDFRPGTKFKYRTPDFLSFQTETMRSTLRMVESATFVVTGKGGVEMPKSLDDAAIRIGAGVYRMGIGGLHSSESKVAHVSDANSVLIDRDVTSYYPAIILGSQLTPKHLGAPFLKVYRTIVKRRLAAKRAGDTVTANSLKITINGSFGKFGSRYSALCSHDLMIQTTITGQLSLLMLIESLELSGIPVVSANTDGVVIKCPREKLDLLRLVVGRWEMATGFDTEETRYMALYSRDVNNYIALKQKWDVERKCWVEEVDGVKLKGAYAPPGLQKNPTAQISVDAAVEYLRRGTSLQETVTACEDIRKFVTVRQVNGGAIQGYSKFNNKALVPEKRAVVEEAGWTQINRKSWRSPDEFDARGSYSLDEAYTQATEIRDAVYLGKAVRWYYALGETRDIRYRKQNVSGNHNKVPRTEGARPLMELPEEFPDDVDYGWYVREAVSILKDVGVDYIEGEDL